jgi:outer membrane receptor for ferrienterochelin and colicins
MPIQGRALAVFLLCAGAAVTARAQTTRITGTVHSTADVHLAGAHVFVTGLPLTSQSSDSGTFAIRNIPPGTYNLKIYRLGYRPALAMGVVVREGEEARVSVKLEPTPIQLDAVVVSVSRRTENVADAPAFVTTFDIPAVATTMGSPVTQLLKQAPGVELTQVGIMSSFVNGRGFNRVFNGRWLTLEDGRVAAFAETGLPIGEHTTIPKVDIASIEVIAGPGSALYGANASGGVMSVRTKDPREHPGLTVEAQGGSREYHDLQVRYAASRGRWGYKIIAEDQAARDWADTIFYPAVTAGGPALTESSRDVHTRATRASGSLRYYMSDVTRVEFNAGASVRDALGQAAQGRYRIEGYQYQNYQLALRSPRWFAQAYRTQSKSGDTYRLQIYTAAQATSPSLTADSLRKIAAFPVDGRMDALEIQYNKPIGAFLKTGVTAIDQGLVTLGGQARRDRVSSNRRLYSDVSTGAPIQFEHLAFYAQLESMLATSLRFVGAIRHDAHNRFPSRWSPKAGLVYDLAADKVVRVTYNSAYHTPSIIQSDVYSLNAAAQLVTRGNSTGFDIRDGSGVLVRTIPSLGPETNETWELGFKGALGRRLYADATVYRSLYRNFMALAGPVANPFAPSPTFAYDRKTGQRIEDQSGNPLMLFTAVNVGEGPLRGLDAAVRYYLSDRVSLSTSTSLTQVGTIKVGPTDPPEASAFNTSALRSSIAAELVDLPRGLEATARARYVQGYEFRSGSDWGRIPTYTSLSASTSYRLPSISGVTLLAQADNVASCVAGTTTAPVTGISSAARATYTPGRKCGFGLGHHEILNMPAVGTMVFVGARYEWR